MCTRSRLDDGWSLHYNKNLECWCDSEGYIDLPDKACSGLHKSLHMGIERFRGALLEAIVATGTWVPLPIPGSMITGLKLKAYLMIESRAPGRSLTYEAPANNTVNGIGDFHRIHGCSAQCTRPQATCQHLHRIRRPCLQSRA